MLLRLKSHGKVLVTRHWLKQVTGTRLTLKGAGKVPSCQCARKAGSWESLLRGTNGCHRGHWELRLLFVHFKTGELGDL